MDYIIKYLSTILNIYDTKITKLNSYICNIKINNDIIGKGLMIGDYILTLSHIMDTHNIIFINQIKYINILNIDFYDICILIKNTNLKNKSDDNYTEYIEKFLIEFNNFIKNNCIFLNNINNILYMNMNDKIYNLIHKKIDNINLKSYLYPSIPMYICNFEYIQENEIQEIIYSGISGNTVFFENKFIGLIVSENSKKEIEILPFEIIYDIIKNYVNNSNNFFYLPIIIINNINQKKYMNINKNDYIYSIDNKELIENNILIEKYNIFIPYQSYILLYCNQKTINIYRKKNNIIQKETIIINLNEYNFEKLFLNYKENINSITIFDITFKELSEEFLIKNNNKNICTIDYNKIYNNKKLIYIDKINIDKLNSNKLSLNIENDIYILNKISGHNINKLYDINKYINNKQITLELIQPNDSLIKIKL